MSRWSPLKSRIKKQKKNKCIMNVFNTKTNFLIQVNDWHWYYLNFARSKQYHSLKLKTFSSSWLIWFASSNVSNTINVISDRNNRVITFINQIICVAGCKMPESLRQSLEFRLYKPNETINRDQNKRTLF